MRVNKYIYYITAYHKNRYEREERKSETTTQKSPIKTKMQKHETRVNQMAREQGPTTKRKDAFV